MSARATVALALIAVASAASSYVLGCSTEDAITFGGPTDCIAGRCLSGSSTAASSSSGGTDCKTPDDMCAVSWKTDLYDPILNGTAKCSDMMCHGDPSIAEDIFFFVAGDASAARDSLLAYQLDNPAAPYVTCANPDQSKFLCNMSLGAGNPNPHGKCGTPMPDLLNDPTAVVLTEMQLDMIAEWIACGAPNN